MNEHILKLLKSIKQHCNEYIEKKIDIGTLQNYISAIHSNFENDVPKIIQINVYNFVEDLEYIRFMYNDNEQYDVVLNKIIELNNIIDQYMK